MRSFVQAISSYAKAATSGFIVIPQNGHALLTIDGAPDGDAAADYLAAIDGVGREDLNYGYDGDNIATSGPDRSEIAPFLDLAVDSGVKVLVTDYCWDPAKVDASYSDNEAGTYISFAADSRDLNTIPTYPLPPRNSSDAAIMALADAANFLYLLDPSEFSDKSAYLAAIAETNYDLVILDLFHESADGIVTELAAADLELIDHKPGGGNRLLICYMSIGEAEDYRFYWESSWAQDKPVWLEEENPNWKGNYKVQYWSIDWQAIILGGAGSYLGKILAAGFDGVYLDIIDGYEYFEG